MSSVLSPFLFPVSHHLTSTYLKSPVVSNMDDTKLRHLGQDYNITMCTSILRTAMHVTCRCICLTSQMRSSLLRSAVYAVRGNDEKCHVPASFLHRMATSQLITRSSRHKQALLNYAGEADEAGNGYTASFLAAAIFQDTPMIRPPKLRLWVQNSVGMWIFRVTTNVQNLGAPDP